QVFEAQHSSYNFDHVDSSLQRELFERYEAEAMRLLELELVYPAYDFVIKANHSYNLLAVRDTLPQPERQTYGQRLRRLSEDVAQCYLERVQAPLLIQKEASADSATPAKTAGASSGLSSATSHSTPSHPATSHPATSHPATSPEESA
ncbi:MAG: glycine--tRNA ligase subunit alpha, partial [Deinococcota bacterium]